MTEAKFKIPDLVMPTPEEMRQSSLRWLERIGPTLIDRWPADLAALSMPTHFIKLPVELMEPLFEPNNDGPVESIKELSREIDAAIGWERKFVRLNSRSPKDSPWPYEIPATLSGKEAVCMLGSSERAMDDLCRFRHIPDIAPAYICLRDFVPGIRPFSEYRCFVKDGELIAVTHYDYTRPWAGPKDSGKETRETIDRYFADKLKPVLPIDTVVFDVHVGYDGPLLIEINPYGLSDPCYFKSYEGVENATGYIEFAPTSTVMGRHGNDG